MVAASVLVLALAETNAIATVYEVHSCGTTASDAFTWTNSQSGTFNAATQCPRLSSEPLSGIFATPRTGTATPDGESAAWRIAAPAGLMLTRLDVQRYLGTRRASWKVHVRTGEGVLLEECKLDGEAECSRGDPTGDTATSYSGFATRSVTFAIECDTDPVGATCSGRSTPQAWIAIYSSVALVDDPAVPVVEPLAGALLGPGWHNEAGRVAMAASDVSGIKRLRLLAGDTVLYDQMQSCDFSRMQPCPTSKRESVTLETSALSDGTHELKAVATDAADQPATATAVLRIDRHAPEPPTGLIVERNPDGTFALTWTNPDQGTAAPITGARYEVCDSAGSNCVAGGLVTGRAITRIGSVALPAGENVVKVWLQDEAGNVDPATAAVLAVDPASISARRVVDTNPPVLLPDGPAPSPRLRVTRARRTGATLTVSGTVTRGATATIAAEVARTKTGKAVVKARTKPRRGKWSLRIRLTPALRKTSAMYLSVTYAGQQSFRKTTLHRRLSKKPPRRGSTATEFSVESR